METKSYTSTPDDTEGEDEDPGTGELPVVDRDRYVFGGELGRGGMGRVIEARDRRLGRDVAIKELLRRTRDHQERFEREALITARLQHPAIIHVYEAGRWPNGKPFYAMPRVIGRSLDKVIAERATLAERIGLLRHVIAAVDALAYAHAQHVIHRDLKPSNVLVGEFGETVVIDWGLAKLRDEAAPAPGGAPAGPASHTAFGSVVGTPGYMAPEQARGEPVDERADVYALGAMLYEVLAGVAPYARAAPEAVVAAVLAGPPPGIREREPGVPRDLAAIVGKAMARDPAARYRDAGELVADLTRFETGQLVAARHYTAWQRAARFVRRHKLVLASAAVLAAVGAVSVVRISAARDVAVAARADAEAARNVATARNEQLVLLQARAELTRDPTSALAWLKRYPTTAPDWPTAAAIAADARARGVAHDVWALARPASSIAFSPDGKTIALGAADGTLTLIDVATGARRDAHAPDGIGDRAVFSPDGALVATSDGHERVRVWQVATGQSRLLAGEHVGGPNVQFSPDGALLMVRHIEGGARLWRMPGGEPVSLPGDDASRQIAFVPGSRAVAMAIGAELSVRDLATGTITAHTRLAAPPRDLVASGDGQWIAAAAGDALVLWRPTTGETRRIAAAPDAVALITPSPDGARFVTCSLVGRTHALWLFDAATGTAQLLASDERCFRQGLAFSPDGAVFLSVGFGGEIRLHLIDELRARELLGHQTAVVDAAFSGDGSAIASVSGDRAVRLWRWRDGDVRRDRGLIADDRMSTTGQLLARDPEGHVMMIDVATGARRELPDVPPHVEDSCLSSTGRHALVIAEDRSLEVYDLAAGTHRRVPPLAGLVAPGTGPSALSADGAWLAQADPSGAIRLVEVATGAVRPLVQLGDRAFTVVFSDDGRLLGVSSRDGTARVIDVASGAERARLAFHGIPWNLAFSPDGTLLAAACTDGLVRVLDIPTARVQELRGHVGSLDGVAFAPDGRHLISTGSDGTVRLWDRTTGAGAVIRREPFMLGPASFVGTSSLVLEFSFASRTLRTWDTRVVPPLDGDPAALVRWLDAATTAQVDLAGELATPVGDQATP
ncbi:MAG TPA: protein kinase [Kofleriaceae bacterium]|nr:protein kinase [Kofleriaceae bacterium]